MMAGAERWLNRAFSSCARAGVGDRLYQPLVGVARADPRTRHIAVPISMLLEELIAEQTHRVLGFVDIGIAARR